MAAKSSLRNMALCLTAVCLICSSVLAGVYALTFEPIKAASQKALEQSISAVLPEGLELSEAAVANQGGQTYEYYAASKAGETEAYAVKSTVIGFGGPLTLMVGILADGSVYNTSVLSHSETPGLGAKCTEPKFHDQFAGWNPSEKTLVVKKDGGDVDAITASTITSRAYTLAVANAVKVSMILNAAGAASNDGGQDNE